MLTKSLVASEAETLGFRHLQEILESKYFERAPVMCGLLLYLWKNRDNDVSEYAIAVDALGRNLDFESKIDATVRVQISRLRRLLAKYYESDGHQTTTQLLIPLGTHQIRLVEVALEAEQENCGERGPVLHVEAEGIPSHLPVMPAGTLPRRTYRLLVPAMGATIVILLFCLGWLLRPSLHRVDGNLLSAKPELPVFWRTFLDNGKSTRLVLPTPLFFSWHIADHNESSIPSDLMVRDISVNKSAKLEDSRQLANIEARFGKPALWQNYTVASDTFAALRLVRFLDSYGIHASISSSAESPHGIIDQENVVAFGTTSSLGTYQSDIDRLSFKLGPHEAYIIDKRLPPGSPGQFPRQEETASRTVTPGLVALLPRGSSGSRILLLQAAQTMALISWLTSEDGMREITQAQTDRGHSPYFEAVVLSEVNDGNPIQSRMVAFRPFTVNGSQFSQMNGASLTSKRVSRLSSAPAGIR